MNFTNFSGVLTISRDIMIECALIVATTDAYIVAAAGIGPESYEKHELASEGACAIPCSLARKVGGQAHAQAAGVIIGVNILWFVTLSKIGRTMVNLVLVGWSVGCSIRFGNSGH